MADNSTHRHYKNALAKGLVVEGAKVMSYISRNGLCYKGSIRFITTHENAPDTINVEYTHCNGDIMESPITFTVQMPTGRIFLEKQESNLDIMLVIEDSG